MTPNAAAVGVGGVLALVAAFIAVGLPGRGRTPAALVAAQVGVAIVLAAHGAELVAGVVLLTAAGLGPLLLAGADELVSGPLRHRSGTSLVIGVATAVLGGGGIMLALVSAHDALRSTPWAFDADGGLRALGRTLAGLEALPLMVSAVTLAAAASGLVLLGRRDERERALERAERARREREERGRRRREDRLRARGRSVLEETP